MSPAGFSPLLVVTLPRRRYLLILVICGVKSDLLGFRRC